MDLARLSPGERTQLVALLRALNTARRQNRIDDFYPDVGACRRELYPKHMEFFHAGARYRERAAICANRVGKTEGMGGYETALHLTGEYPAWWVGRRFDGPVRWWACGKTNETARDIVQRKLLGAVVTRGDRKWLDGTGLVRARCLDRAPTWKAGIADLVDTIQVRHVSGEHSMLAIKSYSQGRGAFEGTEQDGIWLDEEPPLDVYGECLVRTTTTDGMVLCTFTPLEGASDVVRSFLPGALLMEMVERARIRA